MSCGTCAAHGRHCASPTKSRRRAPTRSPGPGAQPARAPSRRGDAPPIGQPAHSFATLLDELATLTRNTVVFDGGVRIDKLATPTALQRRAFELIDASIPVRLAAK